MALESGDLDRLVHTFSSRNKGRTEADVQAGVRDFLLYGGLNLTSDDLDVQLEAQVGAGRRIDVEIGTTVIEIKKDLRTSPAAFAQWETQLSDYMLARSLQRDQRYVGLLTDGHDWHLYHRKIDGTLVRIDSLILTPKESNVDLLRAWLESVLATCTHIIPTPSEINRTLGASSPGHALDRGSLTDLWMEAKRTSPEARLKRSLWAKLLTTAFGENFTNDDELFVEHTYLVLAAEVIAHAVLQFPLEVMSANEIVTGSKFQQAGVYGVVEEDFFDWVLDVPAGKQFVTDLSRRIARFDWSSAEHDVLKNLYESVIGTEQRHRLGEYYTPDWLAQAIVEKTVDDPLSQRVLDPSCGSGTFIFHSIRRFLEFSDRNGISNRTAIDMVTSSVIGVDVHPVAVTLARVTYLLAIGPNRLKGPRGDISVPVYLGDSLQWRVDHRVLSAEGLTVQTDDTGILFGAEVLVFPDEILDEPWKFDRLVEDLAQRATKRTRGSAIPGIKTLLRKHGVPDSAVATLETTFALMCNLHDNHRNHIWSYYARNLARPLWLSKEQGKVDRLVGNPPWLSFRFMTAEMQNVFKNRSTERNLWAGSKSATHQDLSAYFLARTQELYLKSGGRFGFVMPLAALSRQAFQGLRTGALGDAGRISFDQPWDLDNVRPHIFPVPSSAVFGAKIRSNEKCVQLPAPEKWRARLGQNRSSSWSVVEKLVSRSQPSPTSEAASTGSPYHSEFTQGATVVPRVLHMVKEAPEIGGLGLPSGVQRVVSSRSNLEKKPWSDVADRGPRTIESQFCFRLHMGSTLAPHRLLRPENVVLPWIDGELADGSDQRLDSYPLLADWWREAEQIWEANRASKNSMTLLERLDYQRTLRVQLPASAIRVVYTSAGNSLTAAILEDTECIINSDLYWASCATLDEANYLVTILNSSVTTRLVEPLQSRGLFGPRHFHKHVWQLPIPRMNGEIVNHRNIAALGADASLLASQVEWKPGISFTSIRKKIRSALRDSGVASQIDNAVDELLSFPTEE